MMLFRMILAVLVSSLPVAAGAGDDALSRHYTSEFGFVFELGPEWYRLDPSVVPRDPQQLAADPRFAGVDPVAFLGVVAKVEVGLYEFYYRAAMNGFAENIAIFRRPAAVLGTEEEIRDRCGLLPAQLTKVYGREVSPAKCTLRRIDGHAANYIEVEGPIPGTWNLQLLIEISDGQAVALLASVWGSNLGTLRPEFEAMVQSVRF